MDDRWRDTYDQWKLAGPYDNDIDPEDYEPIELGLAEWIEDLDERCGP